VLKKGIGTSRQTSISTKASDRSEPVPFFQQPAKLTGCGLPGELLFSFSEYLFDALGGPDRIEDRWRSDPLF
jgi:hypothetical protein